MMLRPGSIVGLLVLATVIKIADSNQCLTIADKDKPLTRISSNGKEPYFINFEVSKRVSHRLVSEVMKIFLTEVLGYINITFIEKDDTLDIRKAIDDLRTLKYETDSRIPIAIVNMEAWISSYYETTIESFDVKDCGLVTPRGSIGWFVPKDLSNPGDYWFMFTKLESASRFAIDEKYLPRMKTFTQEAIKKKSRAEQGNIAQGRIYIPELCKNQNYCALLLTGYYNETGFVIDYVDKLKLYVKVAFVGSNLKQLTDNLTQEYKQSPRNSSIAIENRSLVILHYMPSSIIPSSREFHKIQFSCTSWNSCHFEPYFLKKVVWSGLEQTDEYAFDVINRVRFSSGMYRDLIVRRNQSPDNIPDEQIACDWLKANLDNAIKDWRPPRKTVFYIGAIFPGENDMDMSIRYASTMAIDEINKNPSILNNYSIKLVIHTGECKPDMVLKSLIDIVAAGDQQFKQTIGILGPACSETVEPLIGVSKHFYTPVISYAAEGSNFDDREKYPYFFRTIGENNIYKYVYAQLFEKLGWHRVASLTEDGQKYTEYISYMQDMFRDKNITFEANIKFPREWKADVMIKYLQDLKEKRVKIIIADVFDKVARQIMCEAYKLQMTATQGYVWFLPPWLQQGWYNTDFYNKDEQVRCTTMEMNEAINGYLGVSHAYFAPDDYMTHENITVYEWRNNYNKYALTERSKEQEGEQKQEQEKDIILSNYAGYAYDAVWTYAYALDRLIHENNGYIIDFHQIDQTVNLVNIIAETDFDGVSGKIKFYGGSSRYSVINIVQFFNNSMLEIGHFYPNISDTNPEVTDGTLDLNISKFRWVTGKQPDDGLEPPAKCFLSGLADLLEVSCEVAIVIANIIIFGLLGTILIIGFIIIKRKYDEKVRLHEKYMKSLGIDLSHTETSSLDIWEIPRDRVVINRKIGEGAFGTVYGGEAFFSEKGWLAVAVKTLKVGSSTDEKLDFLSEVEVMKRFEHKNIIRLLGVCVKCEPVLTVMEFMLYGDLKTYLLARRHLVNDQSYEDSDEISNKRLTAMALDVSRALSYLAQLKYVHRDIASRNCLVNAQRMVKLGDFGMTRPMYENDYYRFNRKGMLPVRWMSPESLGLGIFTPASDVWSYGVLLYEIVTFGSFPFQGMSNNEVLSHVKAGNSLIVPKKVKTQLENLMYSCWNVDNSKRPTAPEIVDFLAMNSRIVSPCLDVPLASVQMEHTGQMDINLSDDMRKFSLPWPSQRSLSQIRIKDSKSIDLPSPLLLDLNSHDNDQNLDPLLVERSCEQESTSPLLDSTRTTLLKQTWPQDNSNARNSQSYKYVNLQPGMIKLNCEPGRNGSAGNIQMEDRTSMLPEEIVSDNMSVL